jgi:hypothetical protein
MTVTINISLMFADLEPFDCSNNQATLGPDCARITYGNAKAVAARYAYWLESPLPNALDYIRKWARSAGAWDEHEIEDWSTTDCLALIVQNIASEMRVLLNVDNCDLLECVETYARTDWELECECPEAHYYTKGDHVYAELCES